VPHRARVVMALRQVGPQLLHGSTEWSCLALPNRSLALGGMPQQQQTLLLRAKKEAVLLTATAQERCKKVLEEKGQGGKGGGCGKVGAQPGCTNTSVTNKK
jgi:hypothetical protein